MTRTAVALCALGLAGLALGATPAEEFTAHGKELLANKEAQMGGVQQSVAQVISSTTFKTTRLRRPGRASGRRADDRADNRPFAEGSRPKNLQTDLKEWVAKAKKA